MPTRHRALIATGTCLALALTAGVTGPAAPGSKDATTGFDDFTFEAASWTLTAHEALGPRFDAQAFHDFVLGQGLLPPDQMEEAVMTEFVPSRQR